MEASPPLRSRNSKTDLEFSMRQSGFVAAGERREGRCATCTELVSIGSPCYTSLKELLSPASPASTYRRDSWREIPIKNPLLQHAAWAYLRPASSPVATDGGGACGCLGKFRERCCGLLEAFNGVVLEKIRRWLSRDGAGGRKGGRDKVN